MYHLSITPPLLVLPCSTLDPPVGGGLGVGGAAIEPDLWAGTADKNWIRLCAAIVYIG